MMVNGMENRIALDVDGTLAATNEFWLELYDHPFKFQDINRWDVWKELGISLDQFLKETRLVWDNHWEDIPLIDEGYKSIDCLDVPIDIVTARSKPVQIKQWLKLHDIPYDKFIRMPGSEYKYLTDHRVYIDDAPNMQGSLYPDQFQLLVDAPWNRHVKQDFGIIRVKSFDEVFQVIECQSELKFYDLKKNGTKWC